MSNKLETEGETTTTDKDKEITTTTTITAADKEITTDTERITTACTDPQTTTTTDKETLDQQTTTTTTTDKETLDPLTTPAGTEGAPGGVKVSKRAHKREQRWLARRERQRAGRREEKRRRDRRRREEGVSLRRERVQLSDPRASGIRVAIDCSYDQLMNTREQEGLAKQIKYCYASNRDSPRPLQLHLCGGTGGEGYTGGEGTGGVRGCLERTCPEHTRWDLHLHGGDITEVFGSSQLTYLTADSSEVITELSAERCYVIGGLLDHNRHKGACLKRAQALGVPHGRLPLAEVVLLSSRAVLAVNHVFDILLRYAGSGDWREAVLGGLPARKISLIKTDPRGPIHTPEDQSEEPTETK